MSVVDTVVARLAERQHGVVARWQLAALGIGKTAVDRRIADGRLRCIHRGVYAVGPIGRNGYWMAAVLACGEGAFLSHRDAAALWDLRDTARTAIDVTVVGARRSSRRRLTVHSVGALHPDDRAEVDRIPVTSIARTLLDLADVVAPTQLQRAYEEAERLRALDVAAIKHLLDRSNGRHGIAALRALLDYDPGPASDSKSELESMLLDLIRDSDLPLPSLNVLVEGFLVDAHWPSARLVIELQSYEYHAHRQAFERDNSKLARLQTAGYAVLPLTHRKLRDEADWVVSTVRAMLDDVVRGAVVARSAASASKL